MRGEGGNGCGERLAEDRLGHNRPGHMPVTCYPTLQAHANHMLTTYQSHISHMLTHANHMLWTRWSHACFKHAK